MTDRNGAPTGPLRVLMIFHSLGLGGAEAWLLALVKEFKRIEGVLPRPIRVDVCLTGEPGGEYYDQIRNEGVRIYHVPFGRRNLLSFARSFRALLSKGGYDVIHDHQDLITGLHLLPGLGLLPPNRIAHVHNHVVHLRRYRHGSARRITLTLAGWLLRRFGTRILGTSSQVLGAYGFTDERYAHLRPEPLYCGIDPSRYKENVEECRRKVRDEMGLGRETVILLFAGRMDAGEGQVVNQKNPHFALQVAALLQKSRPATALLMAGVKPPDPGLMEAWIHEQGLGSFVKLLGPRSDVPTLMLGADLLLFPSLAEGLGMVAVEAQAAGLPVLASDAVPAECVVLQSLVTFLPLQEGPVAWALKAEELLDRPRQDVAVCNQAVARSPFSIEQSARLLLEAYGLLTDSGSGLV